MISEFCFKVTENYHILVYPLINRLALRARNILVYTSQYFAAPGMYVSLHKLQLVDIIMPEQFKKIIIKIARPKSLNFLLK